MSSQLQQTSADVHLSSMGFKGGIVVTDTTAITGNFRAIKALTDCTFTTLTTELTLNGVENPAVGASFGTLSAGDSIPMKITACTLATGSAILFY